MSGLSPPVPAGRLAAGSGRGSVVPAPLAGWGGKPGGASAAACPRLPGTAELLVVTAAPGELSMGAGGYQPLQRTH